MTYEEMDAETLRRLIRDRDKEIVNLRRKLDDANRALFIEQTRGYHEMGR